MSSSRQRILLFVHYNWRSELSDHVLYTLERLRPVFDHVVFISNSRLSLDHQQCLHHVADQLLIRENRGFDFSAWKEGLESIGWAAVRHADSLTLMNDSCFGPLFDLEPLYERMEQQGVDFWGLTNHRASWNRIRWRLRRIPDHLQSYFLVFHRPVLLSQVFFSFWEKVRVNHDFWDVVIRYEVNLTRILRRSGFTGTSLIDTTRTKGRFANWAHYQPDYLIARNSPFIKIKSIPLYVTPPLLLMQILERSSYPVDLIKAHFHRYYRPDISLRVTDPLLSVASANAIPASFKVALHLHLSDLPLEPPTFADESAWPSSIDVYVSLPETMDRDQAVAVIQRLLPPETSFKILTYTDDDHPWFCHAKHFESYDVVGYFLVKDDPLPSSPVRHHLVMKTFFSSLENTLGQLAGDSNLGLVYADASTLALRYPCLPKISRDLAFFKEASRQIFQVMPIDIADMQSFAVPSGGSFWYRPDALKPLLDWLRTNHALPLGWRATNTLRLFPVYSAWMQGCHFRILPSSDATSSSLCHQQAIIDQVERLTREFLPRTINHVIRHTLWRGWHRMVREWQALKRCWLARSRH